MEEVERDILQIEREGREIRQKVLDKRMEREPVREMLNTKSRELEEMLTRNVEIEHENKKLRESGMMLTGTNKELLGKKEHLSSENRTFRRRFNETTELLGSKEVERDLLQSSKSEREAELVKLKQ